MERSHSKTSADLLIADWSRQRSSPARLFGSLRARAQPRELATVRHDPRGPAARMLKASDDRRIKRIGGFICRQSLTDLPQLFNLRRGVLSLVGPRPLISDEHRHVEDSGEMSLGGPRPLILEEDSFVANWGRRRLDLRPGITGTWQVSGRTEIRFEEMVRLDYLYATSWSPWNDVRLILRTLPIVVRGGAG